MDKASNFQLGKMQHKRKLVMQAITKTNLNAASTLYKVLNTAKCLHNQMLFHPEISFRKYSVYTGL